MLSRPSSLVRPHPTPCRLGATSRSTGYTHRLLPSTAGRGRRGPPQFSCLPSAHPALPTPGGSSASAPPGLRRLPWAFAVISAARLPLVPFGLASRGCKIRLMLRAGQSLPPKGLSTLGSDAGRFPPTPPTCYRASWQLPGPDSHRLAVTSLSTWITSTAPPPLGFGWCPRLLGTRQSG